MNDKKRGGLIIVVLSVWVGMTSVMSGDRVASVSAQASSQPSASVLITAQDLKDKILRNESLTIIDVRSTDSYVGSDSVIRGAIHVKLRRLNSRLAFAPLKSVSHDSEVITYCACPNDEASLRAVEILSAAGFKRARALQGGWQMWLKVKGPVGARPKAG